MDQNIIESGGFYFIHNFDSGNLGHVERIPTEHIAPSVNHKSNVTETPDYEFNLWTRPDCAGTEFENGNRTWFYFGVQGSEANVLVRLNIINLNKQGKMYNQGMAPVTRTLPGKPQWERIRDRPIHSTDDNTFTLSFKYRTSDNVKATTFFAFTYPYSFAELQIALNSIDLKMLPLPPPQSPDDIYYHRECLIYSLEGRRVDLLTLTSHHGITTEREDRLKSLFPDNQERPFKFDNKKVIFISARVHPGETPSSFVFNGFLNLLLTRHDPIAIQLRKSYVFKMVPFLNPDGVARGHYRTDTRGVNLNRVYLSPSLLYHPTVYAARALIRYYHFGHERDDDDTKSITSRSMANISESNEMMEERRKRMSGRSGRAKTQEETATGGGEAAHLAEQVYDMKLHEMPSQTEENDWKSKEAKFEEPSLLDESVLRSCLGSGVHLTHSEELQGSLRGANPLRPLRDTLKNSITLLMDSSSLEGESTIGDKDSRMANLKMSWCEECRRFVDKVEETMPSIDAVEPGHSTDTIISEKIYSSIDEYGEHQRKKSERQERKQQITTPKMLENVYFCTNCFKRYALSENNEEVKLRDGVSLLTPTSGGDSSEQTPVIAPRPEPPPVLHPEQRIVTQLPSIPVKDELPKIDTSKSKPSKKKVAPVASKPKEPDSGLYLYIDLHGHASKKGIFMYGNYFEDLESSVECMLLPRIMALNNTHFHFSSCNFTERNMYLKDRRDGMSREGSGRVAVLKATGLVRSYTLECNYNTGRLVNVLPPPVRDAAPLHPTAPHHATLAPPKYTPHIFEEVGRSLGASILDLTGQHPNSRVPCSEHRTLASLRDWLRAHSRTARPQLTMSRLRPKTSSPTRVPLYARSKGKVIDERKENTYVGAKTDTERKRSPPLLAQRSGHDVVNMNVKYLKKSEPVKTPSRTRYLSENEPKPKTLTTKRRNILAIRKPNTSKTQLSGVVKAKMSRRSADDAESARAPLATKLSKRSFARSLRSNGRDVRCKAMASSSSDDMVNGNWEDIRGGTVLGAPSRSDSLSMGAKRRPFPNPSPARLKKSRLKTGL